MVWGRGVVKERGRLGPDYFHPPSSQVREPGSGWQLLLKLPELTQVLTLDNRGL